MQSRSRRIIVKAVCFLSACLCWSSAFAENIRVSYASLGTAYMDRVVAMERGYKLVSNKPEIKTVKDLVGKKVAISTFGDTGHLATLLVLKKHGIPPAAVLFIMVGTNEARAAAFKASGWRPNP